MVFDYVGSSLTQLMLFAHLQAICSEAGMLALRERRTRVTHDDFVKAKVKALYKKKGDVPEGLYL